MLGDTLRNTASAITLYGILSSAAAFEHTQVRGGLSPLHSSIGNPSVTQHVEHSSMHTRGKQFGKLVDMLVDMHLVVPGEP